MQESDSYPPPSFIVRSLTNDLFAHFRSWSEVVFFDEIFTFALVFLIPLLLFVTGTLFLFVIFVIHAFLDSTSTPTSLRSVSSLCSPKSI